MKIINSMEKKYNSEMIMDYNSLRNMIEENYNDYEFIDFLWAHLSNNPNIVVGILEPVGGDKYRFTYRLLSDSTKFYNHTYSLKDIGSNIRRCCGYFKQ
jgi:hypothetical protein